MEHVTSVEIIAGIGIAGVVLTKLVVVGFLVYNTIIGEYNRRQLIVHKSEIKDLKAQAATTVEEQSPCI